MGRKRNNTNGQATATATETAPEVPTGNPGPAHPPVHAIRIRNIRAAIWANSHENGTWYSVTLTRSYRDVAGNWHSTDSFGGHDLLVLTEVARLAFHWITERLQGAGDQEGMPVG